jgi:hypothetical protein
MKISYVIRDARKWEVDPERTASKFDSVYYRGLLEKAWEEAAFVSSAHMIGNEQSVNLISSPPFIKIWSESVFTSLLLAA